MTSVEGQILNLINLNALLTTQIHALTSANHDLKRSIDERSTDNSNIRSAVKSAKPDEYNGNRDKLNHFINSLSLYVVMERKGFSSEELIIVALSFMKKG